MEIIIDTTTRKQVYSDNRPVRDETTQLTFYPFQAGNLTILFMDGSNNPVEFQAGVDTFSLAVDNDYDHTESLLMFSDEFTIDGNAVTFQINTYTDAIAELLTDNTSGKESAIFEVHRFSAGVESVIAQDTCHIKNVVLHTEGSPVTTDPEYRTAAVQDLLDSTKMSRLSGATPGFLPVIGPDGEQVDGVAIDPDTLGPSQAMVDKLAAIDENIADQAEAEAGTDNSKRMTPLTVKYAVDKSIDEHTHAVSDVANLQSELNLKTNVATHASDIAGLMPKMVGVPEGYIPLVGPDGSTFSGSVDPDTLGENNPDTATQVEMESGTEAALRSVSPLLIAQAIAAQTADAGLSESEVQALIDAAGTGTGLSTADVQTLIDAAGGQTEAEVQALIDAAGGQTEAEVQALIDAAVDAGVTVLTGAANLVATDAGKTLELTDNADQTVTIRTNAVEAIPVNKQYVVTGIGTGTKMILAADGVLLNGVDGGSQSIAAQWQSVTLRKRATDEWIIEGALA